MHKLNAQAAHDQSIRVEMCNTIELSLSGIPTTTAPNCASNLTMEWQALSSALASQSILGNLERQHHDWFNDNATDIRSLIRNKNVHNALLQNPTFHTLHEKFSSICAIVQHELH